MGAHLEIESTAFKKGERGKMGMLFHPLRNIFFNRADGAHHVV